MVAVVFSVHLASNFVTPSYAAPATGLRVTRISQPGLANSGAVGRPHGATALQAFDGMDGLDSVSSAMELPIVIGQAALGLAAIYAIMSMAEYVYHRYFQHLGLNKVQAVRTVRNTLQLSAFQGDGHVEHHRETLDDMSLDIEPGREVVLDEDPFRGTSFPWEGTLKMSAGVMLMAYPTLTFIGWAPQVIVPVVVSAMLLHALVWNALHPNMHGLPDVPLEVGAPSFVLKSFRESALFKYLRSNHEGHHRAVGSHGNYNVCCPGVDQIVGTNVDPLTGVPTPKPVPDWVAPLCILAITPLMPAMAFICLLVLVTYPPLPKATAK